MYDSFIYSIPVPIVSVPIVTTGKYSPTNFPTIRNFEPEYKTAGGINLPKIMNCLGSDGKKYKLLTKGGFIASDVMHVIALSDMAFVGFAKVF